MSSKSSSGIPPATSSQATPSSLKPSSFPVARQKMTEYWIKKTIPVVIAASVLPILGIGILNFGVGQAIVNQRSSDQSTQESASQPHPWLLLLLIGSGVTATLAGGLCWLWLKVFVNALVKQSTQLVTQADQSQISESLQDLGRTIGLLQEQTDVQAVLDTSAKEVRSLLNTDRALVLMTGSSAHVSMTAEDIGDNQSSLLQSISQFSTPLEDLFKVPMGYVQVCSQVEDSDLPKSHQSILADLGVQAQMVTQITLESHAKGLLVVQQCTPRDWTEVEHQLFAAIAKQIGIALDRKTTPDQSPAVRAISTSTNHLWSKYQDHCFQLAQSSRQQAAHLQTLVNQSQDGLDLNLMVAQGLQQTRDQIQDHTDTLKTSEKAVNQSIKSITEMQETLAQTTHSSQQLIELGQQISQTSVTIKTCADQVNYQAMNASITAKKRTEGTPTWSLDFTNEMLKLTRDLARQTNNLDMLSTQAIRESQSLMTSADTGAEQILVSAEWFRESRQQLNQMTAVNTQLAASLQRLMDSHHEQERTTTTSHQQLLELDHWLNQAVEESSAMAQSIEQMAQRALA